MIINVNSVSFSQNIILDNIVQTFSWLEMYANHFLYFFISFEVIISGLSWAYYQNQMLERLFFQLLKIGLIIFIIHHYAFILNSLLTSTLIIGKHFSQQGDITILFNPGLIWQYGYDHAIYLLQTASTMGGLALPLLLICLGMGILLVFGIFGIQICLQVLSFYCVAMLSLITMPLSCFQPLDGFFSNSIQSVLQATVRLIVQVLLAFSAVHIWMISEEKVGAESINFYLGLLFSGLLFVMASFYLPSLASKLIGEIKSNTLPTTNFQAHSSGSSYVTASGSSISNHSTVMSSGGAQFYPMDKNTVLSSPQVIEQYHPKVQSNFFEMGAKSDVQLLRQKYLDEVESQRLQEIREIKQAFILAFNDNYQCKTD